jgi:hypothetical protein
LDADTIDATNARIRSGTMGGGTVSFIPGPGSANYTDEEWEALTPAQKSKANVDSSKAAIASIQDLRNAYRAAEGSPPVGGYPLGARPNATIEERRLALDQQKAIYEQGAADRALQTDVFLRDYDAMLAVQSGIGKEQREAAGKVAGNVIEYIGKWGENDPMGDAKTTGRWQQFAYTTLAELLQRYPGRFTEADLKGVLEHVKELAADNSNLDAIKAKIMSELGLARGS